jgi:ABC-2 type transport system permease protein
LHAFVRFETALIRLVALTIFAVPVQGSLALPLLALGVFMACNLAIGFTLSSLATTQMQAQQLAAFTLLPSLLLLGFLFPFAGMPTWTCTVGECLPLIHIVAGRTHGRRGCPSASVPTAGH